LRRRRRDADTTAAIAGHLAGAIYGLSGIPREWLEALAWRDRLEAAADKLFAAGWDQAVTEGVKYSRTSAIATASDKLAKATDNAGSGFEPPGEVLELPADWYVCNVAKDVDVNEPGLYE
jgi:hypothetical protein